MQAPDTKPTRGFSLVASGDVLPHDIVTQRARGYAKGRGYDFRPMFAAIRPIVTAADLAICHLETPLSPTGRDLSGYPVFNGPSQLAAGLRFAGYDACSTASNHAMDQGAHGVAGTLRVLDAAGLRHTGTARNPTEAAPTLLEIRGIRVAMLSYTYGLNGAQLPRGQSWRINLIDTAAILADARAARRAGAQFTVVSLHWGQEYQHAPTRQQQMLARRLLADPAVDLLLGHHTHVVQPVQRINGKWVAFGVGNLLSRQSVACCPAGTQDGVLIHAHVVQRGRGFAVDRIGYTPTWVEHPTYRIRPVPQALASRSTRGPTRAALRASLRRTRSAIGPAVRVANPN
jgi:poly-gamma-glutamate capsule biosynthesis protein CapA/YwtB (metallophosphatase superfamily)